MRARKIQVDSKHAMYSYFDNCSRKANNLANAVRFRQRQVMTAVSKNEADWTDNEREIMTEIRNALPKMGEKYNMPTAAKFFLSYRFLDALLKATKNPDYRADGLSIHIAQHTIKKCVADMKGYFAALKQYNAEPDKFTGKPNLPGYRTKGGLSSFDLSNEVCRMIRDPKTGHCKISFPLTSLRLDIGYVEPQYRLLLLQVKPNNGSFSVNVILTDEAGYTKQSETGNNADTVPVNHARICSVDPGVNNLMAVTNNCGLPCLLYKGGVLKSVNQLYNKKAAKLVSEQTKGSNAKFVPTPEYQRLTRFRNNVIDDCMHKIAKHFVSWCVENRIDTIVLGKNAGWKQHANMGAVNNQNFVQLPFARLYSMIRYLSERYKISVIEQEESYTSQASFLDHDTIPVRAENNDAHYMFSGRRIQRGRYRSADGRVINADLNGSANIGRKAFPALYNAVNGPDFSKAIVIRHPDLEAAKQNRQKQKAALHQPSKSKMRRDAKRRAKA